MKIIKPSYEILLQTPGLEGIYKQIELAGRICYKSHDKITEDSAKCFVDMMIKSNHLTTCEHGTLYFKIPANIDVAGNFLDEVPTWTKCKLVESQEGNWWAITTNLRVMIEHFASEYMEELIENYLCEPTEYHEKRITVKFICSRSISHELVRHRVFSFCQESQRYCNYSKDKFGKEVTFIDPLYSDYDKKLITTEAFNNVYEILVSALEEAEGYYFMLLDEGFRAEEAREVLPNATKTEIVMTGFESDWIRFFNLRCDKSAHPEMRRLTIPLQKEFVKLRFTNE